MYRAMNSRGPNLVPGFKTNPYQTLFFVAYIIVGAFFITNLFVGVVISSFNRESERLGKHFLLTQEQKRWIETKLLTASVMPKLAARVPKGKCRRKVFYFAKSVWFEYFILITITLNTIVLAVKWTGQSA